MKKCLLLKEAGFSFDKIGELVKSFPAIGGTRRAIPLGAEQMDFLRDHKIGPENQRGVSMKKTRIIFFLLSLISALSYFPAYAAEEEKPAKKPSGIGAPKVEESTCLGCHSEIQTLWKMGKHNSTVNCAFCHSETSGHLEDISMKPVTRLDPEACGSCHKDQYRTLLEVNMKSRAKVEKATTTSRSPTFDRLMMPHGFTKEHAE
ncbi:MAG: cytochrome, partial [Deltaproteobacteria bacterium]|nr:cytochrome [Deltaproteobacteria bacterium]